MIFLKSICQILNESALIAIKYFGNVTPTTKPEDNNQVLTKADLEIGKYIVDALSDKYPEHNIIDEEAGVIDKSSEYTWVVDPIEATSNFAYGSTAYGIMIGLLKDSDPVAGGVILPSLNDIYLAEKGQGAILNGKTINASKETSLSKMLFSFGIDSQRKVPHKTVNECRVLADVVLAARNMRNSGCEALDPMYVAQGIYGARINTTSKIWDNVAPQIIAEEAGAIWTDTKGNKIDYSNPLTKDKQNFDFCVAAPNLHNQFIKIIDGRL